MLAFLLIKRHMALFQVNSRLLTSYGVVEWICWLNGQRKKAPTPEVRSAHDSCLSI